MSEKFILAVGNPSDGFLFYGPYDSFEEANDHAGAADRDFFIMPLRDKSEILG